MLEEKNKQELLDEKDTSSNKLPIPFMKKSPQLKGGQLKQIEERESETFSEKDFSTEFLPVEDDTLTI